jgi:dTDP-4-amino-4,6-dideoxygalactose transaminase
MWSRKRLDITWRDLFCGLGYCLSRWDRANAAADVGRAWSDGDDALVCLSVRSAFDLLLASASYPAGSEVLVSAITVPDMVRIIREHGLVPVPLDLDPRTALPLPEQIVARSTPRTRAVLIAHLYGATAPLDAHCAAAREHNLLMIEDCAQAFRGREYRGHPLADVSLFSFGSIKTATALGGAIARVRDAALRDAMRRRQAEYAVQSRLGYLLRIIKYMLLKGASYPAPLRCLIGLFRALGRDHDRLLNAAVRGFDAAQLFALIRRQPCAPLLALLARRLRTFDPARQKCRAERGRSLCEALRGAYECPAADVTPHVFWVFPVLTSRPDEVRRELLRHGFDATQGQSMIVVEAPPGRDDLVPHNAFRLLAETVYLPFYDVLPDAELSRMAGVLTSLSQVAMTDP